MYKDVNLNASNNISYDDTRIKSSNNAVPSFRATNPNAVDTTPTADTYTPQAQVQNPQEQMGPPQQEDMGSDFMSTYVNYGMPLGAALYTGTELFKKANQGEYEKSLLGRMGKFGDKVSSSELISNKYVSSMSNSAKTLKTKVLDFIRRHPKLNTRIRAMYDTPTAPENSFVKGFLETQKEYDLTRGFKALQDEFVGDKNPKTLLKAGATKEEIEALKAKFGTNALGRISDQKAAVQEFLIDKLGKETGHPNIIKALEKREAFLERQIELKTDLLRTQGASCSAEARARIASEIENLTIRKSVLRDKTLAHLKNKYLGFSRAELDALGHDVSKNAGKIEQVLSKVAKFSPKVSCSYNQVKSATAPVSRLGRFLPKITKLGLRGLTFGGGLFNCLFVLPIFLGMAVKNVVDAPKDKKVSTGVHGLFDAMSWVVAMPLAVKSMHAVNGLKNLGKTKEQVNAIETARKSFNNNVKAGLFADRAAYDAGLAELNAVKTANAGVKQKGLNKVLSKVANFLSIGLGQTSKYKETTASLEGWVGFTKSASWKNLGKSVLKMLAPSNLAKVGRNAVRNLPNFGRNCVGYPLRFALYMFAFQPIVDKIFAAPLNALFGKPYDPDKLKEEQEKEAQKNPSQQTPAQVNPNPAPSGFENIDVNSLSDDNLLKQDLIKTGRIPSVQAQPSEVAQSPNGQFNPQQMNNDPNVSEYDNVPRTFIPQIDPNNPIPFHDVQDPRVNPTYEKNYDEAKKQYDKTEKVIADVEAFINEGKK